MRRILSAVAGMVMGMGMAGAAWGADISITNIALATGASTNDTLLGVTNSRYAARISIEKILQLQALRPVDGTLITTGSLRSNMVEAATWALMTNSPNSQTNISYAAVTNAPWQWAAANLTNWAAIDTNVLTGLSTNIDYTAVTNAPWIIATSFATSTNAGTISTNDYAWLQTSYAARRNGGTPYAGVNTWYTYGQYIDGQAITNLVDWLTTSGLKAAGYTMIQIDDGWFDLGTPRGVDNFWNVPAARWPDGLKSVVDYCHSQGFKVGIYEGDGGLSGYNGWYPENDAIFAVTNGFDAIKLDGLPNGGVDLAWLSAFAAKADEQSVSNAYKPIWIQVHAINTGPAYQNYRLWSLANSVFSAGDVLFPAQWYWYFCDVGEKRGNYNSGAVQHEGLWTITQPTPSDAGFVAGSSDVSRQRSVRAMMGANALISSPMEMALFDTNNWSDGGITLTALTNQNVLNIQRDVAKVCGWPIVTNTMTAEWAYNMTWIKPLGSDVGPEWAVGLWVPAYGDALITNVALSTNLTFYFTNLVGSPIEMDVLDCWEGTNFYATNSFSATVDCYDMRLFRLSPAKYYTVTSTPGAATNVYETSVADTTITMTTNSLMYTVRVNTNIVATKAYVDSVTNAGGGIVAAGTNIVVTTNGSLYTVALDTNVTISGTLTAAAIVVNGTNSTTTVSNLVATGVITGDGSGITNISGAGIDLDGTNYWTGTNSWSVEGWFENGIDIGSMRQASIDPSGVVTSPSVITDQLTVNGDSTYTGSLTVSGTGTNYIGDTVASSIQVTNTGTNFSGYLQATNINVVGDLTASGTVLAAGVTNSGLTASRMVLSDANKALVSAAASGAVPIDADGTATSAAQLVTVLGTTAVGRATADASGNTITSTYAPLASPTLTGVTTITTLDSPTNSWAVDTGFPLGTNAVFASGAVTTGIATVANTPASTRRWGQILITASGDITWTNIASVIASDGKDSRTITNGSTAVISVDVWPGVRTNMGVVYFW